LSSSNRLITDSYGL